ncbi:MAG: Asp-tRNA(Asn)/Glu-tRNA(Gln) amidotransferase subunit GatC [Bacteroidota bacterium]|nr:Asp-tRNA(Asn)/Glu-tRNA(Gln) amidotransferase subunit GatC [Bacteroidota bacterium]MDP4233698.1 Asp-tRNA(Asn)/Glu-tRNA(Gln) amidotransferase subunit GatC [Bacteroidota bacterium]MDP4242337.1 Asp-tRNA(Asn)/Glu-tRNA(Gln) amidotransferase subunit GatC [Bacteroidota bacterium]MDP4288711.1 Asp-tRNA(Asn)/Glu-tRNA(Gln) amidotransferase subunit GatC [Bacteroidota bacterium]
MVKPDEVKKVADLAKLEFTEPELAELTGELNHILGYIDQLKELDVSNVEPLENLNEEVEQNALRPDVMWPSLTVGQALSNAPKAADGYFLVPKVLAQETKGYVETDMVGDEEEEL